MTATATDKKPRDPTTTAPDQVLLVLRPDYAQHLLDELGKMLDPAGAVLDEDVLRDLETHLRGTLRTPDVPVWLPGPLVQRIREHAAAHPWAGYDGAEAVIVDWLRARLRDEEDELAR